VEQKTDLQKKHNEQAIVQRWQQGDAAAFDELYAAHAAAIYRLGWAMLRQTDLAEDAVQETFLRAHKAMHRFDPERASFGTWLYQIALNYCRSYLRRKQFFTVPWLSDGTDSPPLPDDRPGPERHALRHEYQQILWQAVQKLSATLREVVILHYYLEIPAVEIAQMLGCPEGTIYSRLHNARHRLARFLTENGLNTTDLIEVHNAH
jgi:RNA polymerase sigma-70 factor (ECF subfamily)